MGAADRVRRATDAVGRDGSPSTAPAQTSTVPQDETGTDRGSSHDCRSNFYVASRAACDARPGVARATLRFVRSTPDLDAKLRARLREAVDHFSEGNAEKFGKRIGYENGGYIRQCLREDSPRPVRSSLIAKMNEIPEMRGWFDALLPPLVASDVRQAAPAVASPWPFKRLTRDQWEALGELQAVVEDVAVGKARELLEELAAVRKASSRKAA